MARAERALAAGLLLAGFAFRVVAAFRYRVNSDEPQHLHVVWAWTQGLLPYRDVFDNHMPLFQLLSVPALLAVGVRPAAILWMRVLLVPVWCCTLWVTFRIGRALFSPRVGLWAAVLGGLWPLFFLGSLEYRPDGLWTLLWLGSIAVLVEGTATPARSFVAGLVLGTALGVSMKTPLLLVALGTALGLTFALVGARRPAALELCRHVAAAAAGLVLVPAAITLFFAVNGALGPYLYGILWHNILPALGPARRVSWRAWCVVAVVPLGLVTRAVARHAPTTAAARRRVVVVLASGLYLGMLYGGWPLVTRQSLLPALPLLAVLGAALLAAVPAGAATRWGGLPALVAVLALARLLANDSVRDAKADVTERFESDVLRLTTPADFVLDLKGQTVFRRRPTFWVFETITQERLRRGLIADDLAARLVATRTPVVAVDERALPPAARRFVRAHYLPLGSYRRVATLRALGVRLEAPTFELPIAATYALVGADGTPGGTLDGEPYQGPRPLAAGRHEYRGATDGERVALLWAPAAAQGFSPFTRDGRWR